MAHDQANGAPAEGGVPSEAIRNLSFARLSILDARGGQGNVAHITSMLAGAPDLESLDISETPIDASGMAVLGRRLRDLTKLSVLRLRYCQINDAAVRVLVDALHALAQREDCRLRVVDLSGNVISHRGATWVAQLVGRRGVLRELALNNCQLGDSGVVVLAGALASNESLRVLDLDFNPIGNPGVSVLASTLERNNKTLEELRLSGGGHGQARMGLAGVQALARMLGGRTGLKVLRLDHQSVFLDGRTKVFFEALAENRTLRSLSMRSCTFRKYYPRSAETSCDGTPGHVASALRKNSTLQRLYLENNGMNVSDIAKLGRGLRRNETLNELRLYNGCSDGVSAARKAAKEAKVALVCGSLLGGGLVAFLGGAIAAAVRQERQNQARWRP
ncbi:unnamed protein product [Pedinophyceae sp. YPF-701]|nr:unnamed protein product [Pedinophyceae sp. YPF-701]